MEATQRKGQEMRQETASNLDTLPKDGDVISFRGEPGAFSQRACHEVFSGRDTLHRPAFEEAMAGPGLLADCIDVPGVHPRHPFRGDA